MTHGKRRWRHASGKTRMERSVAHAGLKLDETHCWRWVPVDSRILLSTVHRLRSWGKVELMHWKRTIRLDDKHGCHDVLCICLLARILGSTTGRGSSCQIARCWPITGAANETKAHAANLREEASKRLSLDIPLFQPVAEDLIGDGLWDGLHKAPLGTDDLLLDAFIVDDLGFSPTMESLNSVCIFNVVGMVKLTADCSKFRKSDSCRFCKAGC